MPVHVGRRACAVLVVLFGVLAASASAAPPTISVSSTIPSGWVTGGVYEFTATAESPGQLQDLTIELPTVIRTKPEWTTCSRCERVSLAAEVTVAALREGVQEIIVVSHNRGGEVAVTRVPIWVDKAAPGALGGIELGGGTGWRAGNRFDVRWADLEPQTGSPIVAARYQLCPLAGEGDCLTGQRRLDGANGIDALSVPGDGAWSLDVSLVHEAGFVGPATATTELRLDTSAPTAAFVPDPADPFSATLTAADGHSGVASMTVEARRQGSNVWEVLASGRGDALAGRLSGDFMAAGTYELRGHAVDSVGNERTVTAWQTGGSVQLVLRAKVGSKLTAGVVSGKRLEARPVLAYGASVSIRGSVKDATGKALVGVPVTVSERAVLPGAPWRSVATAMTGKKGEFIYRARRGSARTIRFEYPGSASTGSASADVTLRVQARTSLTANRRRLYNGDTVTLRGTVRGQPIPSTGKLVTLQARIPGGWRTFGTARARAKDGQWRYRYRFTQTATTARYTFRVVVPQEETFPYVTGVSRRITVVVAARG
jgi:hypothetical protein